MPSIDSFKTRQDLSVGRKKYAYYSLPAAEEAGLAGISRLPRSMKVLLENLLRNEDGVSVTEDDLKAVAAWVENKGAVEHEIAFRPARVLMQDFTGVPAVVDLAAMRDAMWSPWAPTPPRSTRWCRSIWSSTTRSWSTTSARRKPSARTSSAGI